MDQQRRQQHEERRYSVLPIDSHRSTTRGRHVGDFCDNDGLDWVECWNDRLQGFVRDENFVAFFDSGAHRGFHVVHGDVVVNLTPWTTRHRISAGLLQDRCVGEVYPDLRALPQAEEARSEDTGIGNVVDGIDAFLRQGAETQSREVVDDLLTRHRKVTHVPVHHDLVGLHLFEEDAVRRCGCLQERVGFRPRPSCDARQQRTRDQNCFHPILSHISLRSLRPKSARACSRNRGSWT